MENTTLAYIRAAAARATFRKSMGAVQTKPTLVCIVGSPGAGKTVLGHRLATADFTEFTQEKIDEWTLFSQYNADPGRYTMAFQTQVLISNMQTMKEAINEASRHPEKKIILERHLYDAMFFSRFSKDCGHLDKKEVGVLEALCAQLLETLPEHRCFFVYLTASAQTLLDRTRNRARKGEERFDEKYMVTLNEQHDAFYTEDRDDVAIVNTDGKSAEDVEAEVAELLRHI